MNVPYKPVYLPKAYKKFQYVIIHDFSCQFPDIDKAKVDDKKIQMQGVRVYNWLFKNSFELPYHFVCEKIGDDFETMMARPFCYYCQYEDIPSQYLNSVHVALSGNYNIISPTQRTYQQIAYRPIASIVRWFNMSLNNVFFHWEVSTNNSLHCPGDAFKREKFQSAIHQYSLMKK